MPLSSLVLSVILLFLLFGIGLSVRIAQYSFNKAEPFSNWSFTPKEAEHKALSHSAVSHAEVNRHKENLWHVKASQPHSAADFLCALHICQVPHLVRFPSITLCFDAFAPSQARR
jgi:hypothetical protein